MESDCSTESEAGVDHGAHFNSQEAEETDLDDEDEEEEAESGGEDEYNDCSLLEDFEDSSFMPTRKVPQQPKTNRKVAFTSPTRRVLFQNDKSMPASSSRKDKEEERPDLLRQVRSKKSEDLPKGLPPPPGPLQSPVVGSTTEIKVQPAPSCLRLAKQSADQNGKAGSERCSLPKSNALTGKQQPACGSFQKSATPPTSNQAVVQHAKTPAKPVSVCVCTKVK